MPTSIKTVAVIGTGVIGASWTALFLARGLHVIVSDPAPEAKSKLEAYLRKELPVLEKIGLSDGASLSNYTFVENIDDHLPIVDFVQENAPERLEFKRTLFANIDSRTREDVIIASSSSGIPSSQFVTGCKKNPGRVLIGHPFNPPHLVPLVEVVPHPGTEAKYTTQALEFYQSLNKSPILVRKECPGFIANRLQAALCNEAYSLIEQGIVSAEELVTAGLGLRWALTGPFMTNILGGGGGKTGFKHLIEHLGPATQVWKKDMDAHAFKWDTQGIGKLDASVQDLLSTMDPKVVEEQRDEVLVKLILLKTQTSALV
ncbi:hypothetical protein B7463_g4214, partial [Scytalidium lignicola]